MMEHNRVFRPGQSGGSSSTFNIAIPRDQDLYISDSDSDNSGSDKPGSSLGSSSPSGSSTATIETSLGTPEGNAANGSASARNFSVTSVGCQTPPPSILKDSRRLSFSVTWASNDDETSAGMTGSGAAEAGATGAGATGSATSAVDAAETTTMRDKNKDSSPREFLLRCPPGPDDRLEEFGKIARVAEFCQHPVLACFMYTALAVEAAIGGGGQESPPVQTSAATPAGSSAAPPAASFVALSSAGSPAVAPPVASSSAELLVASSPLASSPPVTSSPVESRVESPPVESASPVKSESVASSVQSSPVESQAAGQPSERQGQGQSLEGQSSSKGKVEDPPRAHRGWGLAKGAAAVAVGIAIGAAFVSRRH